jgi:hypothetical protein
MTRAKRNRRDRLEQVLKTHLSIGVKTGAGRSAAFVIVPASGRVRVSRKEAP